MAFYILITLLIALIGTSLLLHYGFNFLDMLPENQSGKGMQDQKHFQINYTFFLNMAFLAISGLFIWFKTKKPKDMDMEGHHHGHAMADKGKLEGVLKVLAIVSYIWLAGGLVVRYFVL